MGASALDWIVGHYSEICTFALNSFGFITDSSDKTAYPSASDNTMVFNFGVDVKTASSVHVPLSVRLVKSESKAKIKLRDYYTQLRYLPDPWPGAQKHVQQARLDGRTVVSLIISCDSIAYEVFVCIPSPRILAGMDYNAAWTNSLDDIVNSAESPREEKKGITIAYKARPVDSHMCLQLLSNPWGVRKDFVDFYQAVWMACSYGALAARYSPTAGHRNMLAVDLKRCYDEAAFVHYSCSYMISSWEKIEIDGIVSWLHRLQQEIDPARIAKIVHAVTVEIKEALLGDGKVRAPALIVGPDDSVHLDMRWFKVINTPR
jgi:hypothetical protein